MTIDARIPLMAQGVDLQDIMAKSERIRAMRAQREGAEAEVQGRRRLGELLPQAVQGNQAATNEIAGIDPQLFLSMDARQREHAAAGVADLTAAVRWADTPEKWSQVQQHYLATGVDLTPYGFEKREEGMLKLGKIGEYLKSAPKPEYRSVEAGGSLIDVSNGQPRVVIAPNDGSQQMGAPTGGNMPRVSDEASYNAVPPGAQYIAPDGHVRVKQGGPTQPASGGFPLGPQY